jgi:hypothetical protein
MNKFVNVDYFNIERPLSQDKIMVCNPARGFVDEKVIPKIERHFKKENFLSYLIMCYLQSLESVKTYEGIHEMRKLIMGESITGFAAFD